MIDGQNIQLTTSEMLGLSGAIIYSVSYLLSAYDRLPSQSPIYYVSKLVAAGLVLVSLYESFNLASVVIQVFFVVVSMIGIVRHLDARRRRRAYEKSQHAIGGATVGTSSADFYGRFKDKRLYAPPDR